MTKEQFARRHPHTRANMSVGSVNACHWASPVCDGWQGAETSNGHGWQGQRGDWSHVPSYDCGGCQGCCWWFWWEETHTHTCTSVMNYVCNMLHEGVTLTCFYFETLLVSIFNEQISLKNSQKFIHTHIHIHTRKHRHSGSISKLGKRTISQLAFMKQSN